MSSKSNTIVNLVMVFFISLFAFSIGTFVGKKYSDNQHQLSSLEPSKTAQREVASVHETGTSEKVGSAMSDDEIAKLAEEFVTDDQGEKADAGHGEDGHGAVAAHGDVHGTPAAAATKGHDEPKAKTETATKGHSAPTATTATNKPSAVAQELAAGKTPAAGYEAKPAAAPTAAKENRVPSSLPKDVAQYAVGKFTVQVAAYGDEAEAKKMATDLKAKGYSAFYIPANVKGKTWYRVSVGQFATQKEAQNYRGELVTNANLSSAMVQKITE